MAPLASDHEKGDKGSLDTLDDKCVLFKGSLKDMKSLQESEDPLGSLLKVDSSKDSDTDSQSSSSEPPMSTRLRVVHTVLIYFTFLGFGLCRGVYGPTLVELRTVTGVSSTQVSMLFTCLGVGGIAGSLTFGRLFDILNPLVLFVGTLTSIAVVTTLIPWLNVLTAMMAACAAHAFLYSGLAIGCTVTLFRLWRECSRQIFLAMHLLYTVGSLLAPLLAKPFLSAYHVTPSHDSNVTSTSASTNVTSGGYQQYSPNAKISRAADDQDTADVGKYLERFSLNLSQADDIHSHNLTSMEVTRSVLLGPSSRQSSRIVYTYLIIGAYLLLVGVGMFCLLLYMRLIPRKTYWKNFQPKGGRTRRNRGSLFRLLATMLFILYTMNFGGQEMVYSGLLFTFAVDHVGFTPARGTLLVSMLYTAHTAGRFFSVIVSHWVPNALHVLLCSVAGCSVSCALLTYYTTTSAPALWAAAVIGGLSLSTMYGMGLLWAKDFVPISATFTSFYTIAYTGGMMLWPPLTSYCMKTRGAAWFAYINVILLVNYTIAIALLFTLKRCRHRFQDADSQDEEQLERKVKVHEELIAHSMHSLQRA